MQSRVAAGVCCPDVMFRCGCNGCMVVVARTEREDEEKTEEPNPLPCCLVGHEMQDGMLKVFVTVRT